MALVPASRRELAGASPETPPPAPPRSGEGWGGSPGGHAARTTSRPRARLRPASVGLGEVGAGDPGARDRVAGAPEHQRHAAERARRVGQHDHRGEIGRRAREKPAIAGRSLFTPKRGRSSERDERVGQRQEAVQRGPHQEVEVRDRPRSRSTATWTRAAPRARRRRAPPRRQCRDPVVEPPRARARVLSAGAARHHELRPRSASIRTSACRKVTRSTCRRLETPAP